jgi:signal transduction histidine kinase
VLQRFYQLERGRTTAGTGLSLSTAAATVALYDAVIELLDKRA